MFHFHCDCSTLNSIMYVCYIPEPVPSFFLALYECADKLPSHAVMYNHLLMARVTLTYKAYPIEILYAMCIRMLLMVTLPW